MELTKTKYKETEVGLIPDDWQIELLGNLCTIFGRIGFRGYTKADIVKEHEGAITLSPSNIQNSRLVLEKCTFISWKKYHESPEIKIYNRDILLVKTGSTFGKTAIVNNLKRKATLNPQVVVLKKIKIPNEFLGFLMQFEVFQNQINSTIVGGAIPTLSQKQVANFKIPIPPTENEQKLIAQALTDTDALIQALEKKIAKKKLIKKGVMQRLLTPKKDWLRKTIKDLVSTPVTDGPHETPKFVKDGIPFLSVNNIVNNKIDKSDLRFISIEDDLIYSRKCKPQKNDILLGKAASVGKVAIVEDNWNFNVWSPLALIRTKDLISPFFLYYFFQTSDIILQIEGLTNSSSQGNIGMGDIEKLIITFPEELIEQEEIANTFIDMDKEIEVLEQKLSKYQLAKQGMMQKLLTGKIRLV